MGDELASDALDAGLADVPRIPGAITSDQFKAGQVTVVLAQALDQVGAALELLDGESHVLDALAAGRTKAFAEVLKVGGATAVDEHAIAGVIEEGVGGVRVVCDEGRLVVGQTDGTSVAARSQESRNGSSA